MRARQMMSRLDRLPRKSVWDRKVPDLSLLPAEKQDRVGELFGMIPASKNVPSAKLDTVFAELDELVRDLPLIGPDDPEQGPLIEVPGELAHYWQRQQSASKWRSLDFYKLSKVQTLRFVALCEQYGFRDLVDGPLNESMLPLHAWKACDRSELEGMLDIAASSERRPWWM